MIFEPPEMPAQYAEVIERIELLKKQLSFALQHQPRPWSGLLRRSTFARAIQASNSIEGYNVTIEEAIAAVERENPPDEKTEAWMAVSGYRDAMSYILQLADDPFYSHNEGTIRSLHYMLLSYDIAKHPGRWRPGAIFVRREPTQEIVYEGPGAELVPKLMGEFIQQLNLKSDVAPIIRAAMAHLNLVMIHPFSDGNGRMARALQTMVLAREGTIDANFCSIEEYLGRNTQAYYDVLGEVGMGAWHPENNSLPWIKFCLIAHFQQAETLHRRIREGGSLWLAIELEIKRRDLNERMIAGLYDAAMGYRIRNQHYRAAAEVSEQIASRDLLELVGQQLIVPHGEKRGRFYVAGEWLLQTRHKTRETKIITDPFTNTTISIPRAQHFGQTSLPGLEAT